MGFTEVLCWLISACWVTFQAFVFVSWHYSKLTVFFFKKKTNKIISRWQSQYEVVWIQITYKHLHLDHFWHTGISVIVDILKCFQLPMDINALLCLQESLYCVISILCNCCQATILSEVPFVHFLNTTLQTFAKSWKWHFCFDII